MAIEIVDFPINSRVIFHGKMLVHQRVTDCEKVDLILPGLLGISGDHDNP